MKFKKVNKMDMTFSALGYGCWGASGSPSWTGHTDQNQIKAIHTAIDGGINFFDVAPVYGLGHAEKILGQALQGRRNQVLIATKCGLPWNREFQVRNDVREHVILKEIDESLSRLQVDHVDLYQIHWPTADGVAIEETMSALNKILQSGKARYVGLTNFSVENAKEANQYVDIASMQGLYNLLEQNADTYHNIPLQYRVKSEVLPFTQEKGMAFFPYSPLFQGLLGGAFNKSMTFNKEDVRNSNPKLNGELYKKYYKIIEELMMFSKEIGRPLNEIALNWLIKQNAITSVIAGVRNASQVKDNLKALDWTLEDDAYQHLNKISGVSQLID